MRIKHFYHIVVPFLVQNKRKITYVIMCNNNATSRENIRNTSYEDIVNIVRDNLENADAREIFEHIAFQFNKHFQIRFRTREFQRVGFPLQPYDKNLFNRTRSFYFFYWKFPVVFVKTSSKSGFVIINKFWKIFFFFYSIN